LRLDREESSRVSAQGRSVTMENESVVLVSRGVIRLKCHGSVDLIGDAPLEAGTDGS